MPQPTMQPHTPDDVNTDAQLAELTRMSDELRQRLESMIAEQRERVEKFTASQLSLSPLPQVPQPQQSAFAAPQYPTPSPQQSKPVHQNKRQKRRTPQPPPPPAEPEYVQEAARPELPPLPPQTDWEPQPAPQIHRPAPVRRPVVRRTPQDEESAGSYGWVVTVGIFILIIIMRSCG